MNEVQIGKPIDPVERSIAKPDAFSKPAAFTSKPAAKAPTRFRTMDWKRTKGRPRKRPMDPRKVHFFVFLLLCSLV